MLLGEQNFVFGILKYQISYWLAVRIVTMQVVWTIEKTLLVVVSALVQEHWCGFQRSKRQQLCQRHSGVYISKFSSTTSFVAPDFTCKFLLRAKRVHEIFSDNKSTISMDKNISFHGRTKHIDVQYHFILTPVGDRRIVLKFYGTNVQAADIFTKSFY